MGRLNQYPFILFIDAITFTQELCWPLEIQKRGREEELFI